jgi:hypothetical protein
MTKLTELGGRRCAAMTFATGAGAPGKASAGDAQTQSTKTPCATRFNIVLN